MNTWLPREQFVAATVNADPKHSYLTMNIVSSDKDIAFDMSGYLHKVLAEESELARVREPLQRLC